MGESGTWKNWDIVWQMGKHWPVPFFHVATNSISPRAWKRFRNYLRLFDSIPSSDLLYQSHNYLRPISNRAGNIYCNFNQLILGAFYAPKVGTCVRQKEEPSAQT
jgi:hypothetical protein